MEGKRTIKDVVLELRRSDDAVMLSDATKAVLGGIALIAERSPSLKRLKEIDAKLYNSVINTVFMTTVVNLAAIGKTEEEAKKLMSEIAASDGAVVEAGIVKCVDISDA